MKFLKVYVVIFCWLLLRVRSQELKELPPCNFKAIFNFGDSNSDTGGMSAAFYPAGNPSGETFFREPAGRGSDGRLMIDFIAQDLGLPYLSAYLDSFQPNFRHGTNFATGGATILRYNESWFLSGVSPFPLDIQVAQHRQFKARTLNLYKQGKKHRNPLPRPNDFSQALYIFDIGQNDIAAGFRMTNYKKFAGSVVEYVKQLSASIQDLYSQGGRTFWIHNTGPIGCLALTLQNIHDAPPGYVDQYGCAKDQNDIAIDFNRQLKLEIESLRAKLPDAALTYVDIFATKLGLITNALKEGFVDPGKICCGYHKGDIQAWCGQTARINGSEVYFGSCEDPSRYISWDGVHYTEAANRWFVNHISRGSLSDPPIPITHSCYSHKFNK
ncbi:hypothetical protein ACFE04_025748 [Oxalis oulophora]